METRIKKSQQDYEKRNSLGFEGDHIMAERVRKFINDYEVNLVIELGSYLGATAKRFSTMCDSVITIEINAAHYTRAKQALQDCKNVKLIFGDTVEILPKILPLAKESNILIWIDSHWESNNPLIAELEIIRQSGLKPILGIHDFKVPNHPELGFDTYKDIVYEWSWIEKSIIAIYGEECFGYHYNHEAEGAKRGVIYIYPE